MASPVRARVRAAFFDLFRRAAATDDARRATVDMLGSLVDGRRPVPWRADHDLADIYPELPRPVDAGPAPLGGPIFITGRFRSGSTLLWNLMRHLPGCTAYYEPFNENAWAAGPLPVDPTHKHVTDYWREYAGVRPLAAQFRPEWATRNLFMDASSWDPGCASTWLSW